MIRTVGLCASLIALGGLAIACGAMDASGLETEGLGPDGSGDSGPPPVPTPGSTSTDGVLDNAVILVHAAKAQSFRLCFANELDRRPQPDSDVMPEANVVGVEVGSTVRLGPLAGAPGEVFMFDEPSIRAFYPQFGGAGTGPTCGALLSASNPLNKSAVKLGAIDKNLHTGVHLLVVRGCPGDGALRQFSVAECGAGWTKDNGNLGITEIELNGAERPQDGTLSAQIVNLSQPLDSQRAARDVVVSFGDLTASGAKLEDLVTNPKLFGRAAPQQPAQLKYPSQDPAVFGSAGFRVSYRPAPGDPGGEVKVLEQTLEKIQELSAPRDVPRVYYGAASNYALLLLGDPNALLGDGGPDSDYRRNLHFLAVPVVEPKPDGGTGAGPATLDGGATPTP